GFERVPPAERPAGPSFCFGESGAGSRPAPLRLRTTTCARRPARQAMNRVAAASFANERLGLDRIQGAWNGKGKRQGKAQGNCARQSKGRGKARDDGEAKAKQAKSVQWARLRRPVRWDRRQQVPRPMSGSYLRSYGSSAC